VAVAIIVGIVVVFLFIRYPDLTGFYEHVERVPPGSLLTRYKPLSSKWVPTRSENDLLICCQNLSK
jgi:hypothetical protein